MLLPFTVSIPPEIRQINNKNNPGWFRASLDIDGFFKEYRHQFMQVDSDLMVGYP